MDIFFEFLVEVYLSISEIFVPENKFKKWQETLLKLLCIFVCLAILGSLVGGIIILTEGDEALYGVGVALVCIGSALFAMQVALVIVAVVHDIKKQRAKTQKLLDSDVQDLINDIEE